KICVRKLTPIKNKDRSSEIITKVSKPKALANGRLTLCFLSETEIPFIILLRINSSGSFVSIYQLAMIFFIVTNPIGNSPAIIALIKDHSLRDQQKILLRESLFAMLLAIFFLFLGETFLNYLHIQNYALRISGGVLLFIVALKMIFSVTG